MCMRAGHIKTQLTCYDVFLLSHHFTLDDLLKFNDIGKECAETIEEKSFYDTMMIMTSIRLL